VVVVLAAQDVYMQRAARRHGEGMEYVREHLCREITDLFASDAQVGHAIWARADIDDRARKSLLSVRFVMIGFRKKKMGGDKTRNLPRRAEQSPCRIDGSP
jgi:hypothetical protein